MGSYFVDRPPLLLAIFRLADVLGGIGALRAIGAVLVTMMVMCAGWAGWLIGSYRGARWAALVAAALASNPVLGTMETDGELLAAPLVLLGCCMVLRACRGGISRRRQAAYAASAGISATAALLVKQSFFDVIVFAAVLLAASAASHTMSRSTALRLLAGFATGAALLALAVVVATLFSGAGLDDLWFGIFGVRMEALHVISTQGLTPMSRVARLVMLAVDSGMASLIVTFVVAKRRAFRQLDPITAAVGAMLAGSVFGIALGASYWHHYLIQLVPALVLAAALLALGSVPAVRWARVAIAGVVVSAVVASSSVALQAPQPRQTVALESWLRAAAKSSDTLFAWGHADIVEASGLQPARYPYLWGLLILTLDPLRARLDRTLDGSDAPIWIVQWANRGAFRISHVTDVGSDISQGYRRVAEVCGASIYLENGTRRSLPKATAVCSGS